MHSSTGDLKETQASTGTCVGSGCVLTASSSRAALLQLDTRELLVPKTAQQGEGRLPERQLPSSPPFLGEFYLSIILVLKINILKGKLSLPERWLQL